MSKVFNPTVSYHSPLDGGTVNLTIDDQTLHDLASNGEVDLRFDYNENDDVDTLGRVEFVDKKDAIKNLESVINFDRHFKKPIILTPGYNSLSFDGKLKASPFEAVEPGWTHFKTIWTISIASNFIDDDIQEKNKVLTVTSGDLTSALLATVPRGDKIFIKCEYFGRSPTGEEKSLSSSVRVAGSANPNVIAFNSILSIILEKDISSGLISFPRLAKFLGWVSHENEYNPAIMDGSFLELLKFNHTMNTTFIPNTQYPLSLGRTASIKLPLKFQQTPTTSIIRFQNTYNKTDVNDTNPEVKGILFTLEDGNKSYFSPDTEKIIIPNVDTEFSFNINCLKFECPELEKTNHPLFKNYFFLITKKPTPGTDDGDFFSYVSGDNIIELGGTIPNGFDFNFNSNSKITLRTHSFEFKDDIALSEPGINIYIADTDDRFNPDSLVNNASTTLRIESLDPEATDIQVEYYSIGKYTNDNINLNNTGVYTISSSPLGKMTKSKTKKFKFDIGFNTNYRQEETGALELGVVELGYMIITVIKPNKTNKFFITTKHGEEFQWSDDVNHMHHVIQIKDNSNNSYKYHFEPISNKNLDTEWSIGIYGCPTLQNKTYKLVGMIFDVPNNIQSIFSNIGDTEKHRFKATFDALYKTPNHNEETTKVLSFGRKITNPDVPNDLNYTPPTDHYAVFFPYLSNVNDMNTLGGNTVTLDIGYSFEYKADLKYNGTIDGSTTLGNYWWCYFQSKLTPSTSGILTKEPDHGYSLTNKRYVTYSYNLNIGIEDLALSSFQYDSTKPLPVTEILHPVFQGSFSFETGGYNGIITNELNPTVIGSKTKINLKSNKRKIRYMYLKYVLGNYCDVCKKYHNLPDELSSQLSFDGNYNNPILKKIDLDQQETQTPMQYIDMFGIFELTGGFNELDPIPLDNLVLVDGKYQFISNVLLTLLTMQSPTSKKGTFVKLIEKPSGSGDSKIPNLDTTTPGMSIYIRKIILGDITLNSGDSMEITWERLSERALPAVEFTKDQVKTWNELIKKNAKKQFNVENLGNFYMDANDFIRFIRGDDNGMYWKHLSSFTRYSDSRNGGPLVARLYKQDNGNLNNELYWYGELEVKVRNSLSDKKLKGSIRVREYSGQGTIRGLEVNLDTSDDITVGYLTGNIVNTQFQGDVISFILFNSKTSTSLDQDTIDKITYRYPSFKQINPNGDELEVVSTLQQYFTLSYTAGNDLTWGENYSWSTYYRLNLGTLGGDKTTTIKRDPFSQTRKEKTISSDRKTFQRPEIDQIVNDFFTRHKEYAQNHDPELNDLCQFMSGYGDFVKYITGLSDYDSNYNNAKMSIVNQLLQHPGHTQYGAITFNWSSNGNNGTQQQRVHFFTGYNVLAYENQTGFFYKQHAESSARPGWYDSFYKENQGCFFYSLLVSNYSATNKVYGGRIVMMIYDGSVNDINGRDQRERDPNNPHISGFLVNGIRGFQPGQLALVHTGSMKAQHEVYSGGYNTELKEGDPVKWIIGCVRF